MGRMRRLSAKDKVKIVTEGNLDDVVRGNSFTIIDCWAPWCAPCRMISPIIDELAEQYSGRVAFGKLNLDENVAVAERFGIMAIPTILFFREGKLVDTIVGAVPKTVIEDKIYALIRVS